MDKTEIPVGDYCYTSLGWKDGKYKIKVCPYWSYREDKPEQECGYCSYLNSGDWEGDGWGLLWDMVKECNVNMYDDE